MPRKTTTTSSPVNETNVMTSVSSVIGFIKTHVSSKLVEASNRNLFQIEETELRKINDLLGPLIDEAFVKSSGEIINSLKQ